MADSPKRQIANKPRRIKDWTHFFIYLKRNHLHLVEIIIITVSAFVIWRQLKENTKQNKVSIRGQLYETEASFSKEAREDDDLNSIWLSVPVNISGAEYSKVLLSTLTTNPLVLNVKTAEELYNLIWGYETMIDSVKMNETRLLRKVYLYAQSYLYHIHDAFDYEVDNILDTPEWETWKGIIREMSAHPIFITTIWQGYRFNYFSKNFAQFLVSELCTEFPLGLKSRYDSLDYFRDKEFIVNFYPDMVKQDWSDKMPDY